MSVDHPKGSIPLYSATAVPVLEADIAAADIPALAAEVEAEAEEAEAKAVAKRRAEDDEEGTAKKSKSQHTRERTQRRQQNTGTVFIPAVPGKRTRWKYELIKARLTPGVTLLTTRQEWEEQTKDPCDRKIEVQLQDGQQNWKESAFFRAALRQLDPNSELHMEDVLDGLGPDIALQERGTSLPDLFAAIQGKSAEGIGTQVNLSVEAADGAPGGRYEKLIIVGVIGTVSDRQPKRTMTTFGRLPDVQVTDIFLFSNATQMPNITLQPYPRTAKNKGKDAYGDHRYTVGVDSLDRLEQMRREFFRLVREGSRYTKEDIWLCNGPNTLSPVICFNHTEEILNCRTLACIVGLNDLRASVRQNETVDVVWTAVERGRFSLKSATEDHGGGRNQWNFNKCAAPFSELCDYVLVFYRDKECNRTHVSVIPAVRVYDTRASDGTFVYKKFVWSGTNNADVLRWRIDLRQPDALSLLRAAVSGV
ncbi:hypothetical protein JKP88DRAFT_246108 [Tribonema minus]|uniref:Uncharacterized protein n=1 Tax=Tribonema minus TaxID=303371 RepID=A0A835YUE2_9STRA|nr:hypothetical protein JKP88DRAFT_246108 [Tribonema minus]